MAKSTTFISAMRDFFGLNGGTLQTFLAETKKLTDDDKAEFKAMLEATGAYVITA